MLAASPKLHGPAEDARFQVCVVDRDAALPSEADIKRLFGSSLAAATRHDRLAHHPRLVVSCVGVPVGIAAYERIGDDLRVPEFVVARSVLCSNEEVAETLINALEIACLATGGRQVVVARVPGPVAKMLVRRGYQQVREDCAGSWFEKGF
jgi:hypothetical protein